MKKQPIVVAVIGYIIGILWGLYFKFSIVLCYLLMAATYFIFKNFFKKNKKDKIELLSIKRYKRYLKLIIDKKIIIIIIFSSIISNIIVAKENQKYDNIYKNNEKIEITGIIIGEKKEKQYYNLYKIKVNSSKNFNLYIQVNKKQSKDFEYGDKIRIKGEFKKPNEQKNYKGYDEVKNFKMSKIAGRIKAEKITVIGKRKTNIIMKYANDLRNTINKKIEKNFEKDKAAIVKSLILGDKEDISQETKENFQITSISHILAISGMHINYIIVFLKSIFEKILGKRKTKSTIIIFLIFYVLITGFSPSIIRAVITNIIVLGEIIFYRKSDFENSIAISLFAILIYNPFLILNIGLQLSYFSTIGIVLLKPIISQILNIKIKYIKEILVISLSAQIMILPISLYHFNKLGIYFLITNFLVSIIIGPIFILGIISVFIPFIFSKITSIGLLFLNFIGKFSKLPLAKIYIATPSIFVVISYFIIIFLGKRIYMIYKAENLNTTEKRIKNLIQLIKYKIKFKNKSENKRKVQKKAFVILFLLLTMLIVILLYPKPLKIHFVDVGQGDCTFIITPKNNTILIDGGGSQNKDFDVGKSILVPYLLDRGYTKIDYIIISHFDQDHIRAEY